MFSSRELSGFTRLFLPVGVSEISFLSLPESSRMDPRFSSLTEIEPGSTRAFRVLLSVLKIKFLAFLLDDAIYVLDGPAAANGASFLVCSLCFLFVGVPLTFPSSDSDVPLSFNGTGGMG